MLINLTNHPVKGVFDPKENRYRNPWSEEQIKAAIQQYDEIIELPFPVISPYWTAAEIKEEALEYTRKCISLLKEPSTRNAVHIGGETMFCFYMTTYLLREGYQVVSASSDRIIEAIGENKIIKKFQFINFRKYE